MGPWLTAGEHQRQRGILVRLVPPAGHQRHASFRQGREEHRQGTGAEFSRCEGRFSSDLRHTTGHWLRSGSWETCLTLIFLSALNWLQSIRKGWVAYPGCQVLAEGNFLGWVGSLLIVRQTTPWGKGNTFLSFTARYPAPGTNRTIKVSWPLESSILLKKKKFFQRQSSRNDLMLGKVGKHLKSTLLIWSLPDRELVLTFCNSSQAHTC